MKSIHRIDPGDGVLKPGNEWIYYVDGFRRYMGTVKFHLYPECHILQNHKAGRGESDYILMSQYPIDPRRTNVCWYCRLKEATMTRSQKETV